MWARFLTAKPKSTEYTLAVKGGFIDGERNPATSASLGSMINQECRKKGKMNLRKNVVFEIIGHRAVVRVIKEIKEGKELITVYNRKKK